MLQRSGEVLLTIINEILDFSKIEAGMLAIESSFFDLRLLIEEVDELLAPRAEDRKLDLILQYSPGVPRHFIGDAGRIRQVLINPVSNAVKFTDQAMWLPPCRVPASTPGRPPCESRSRIPAVPLEDSLRNMAVIDAIVRSAETGTWVNPAEFVAP